MRTKEDKLRSVADSLAALQPGALVSAGKGAAAYHAWTLYKLAGDAECRDRMLQVRAGSHVAALPGEEGGEFG